MYVFTAKCKNEGTVRAVTRRLEVMPDVDLGKSIFNPKKGSWQFHLLPKEGCECNLCTLLGRVKDFFPGLPEVTAREASA